MITIEALPARSGDCLWVEWDDQDSRPHRMLIDGGWGGASSFPPGLRDRFARQPVLARDFDLVVCTHVDDDHIGGLIALLTSPPDGFAAQDIWFNGPLRTAGQLGWKSGFRFARLLKERSLPWNAASGGGPLVVPDVGPLPAFTMPGLTLTLLSPTRDRLRALQEAWPEEEPDRASDGLDGQPDTGIPWRQLADEPYVADASLANGSSIAFCAEHWDGSRVLFGADAHAEVLVRSLHRVQSAGRYRVDVCKVPHHASAANVSPALIRRIDCGHWLVSTHGGDAVRPASREARYRPGEGRHPSARAMARIIYHSGKQPTFWFNYLGRSTERYRDATLAAGLGFRAEFPREPAGGIGIRIEAGRVSAAARPGELRPGPA